MKLLRKHGLFGLAFAAVLLSAVAFRAAGLWHGLGQDLIFHPDAPKQVLRLEQYLHGQYVSHHGSRFYDGYPYGLNRVDEGLLRLWLGASDRIGSWMSDRSASPSPAEYPARGQLYRQGRVLRLLYGVLAALLVFASARRWGAGRWAALAGAALYAAAPLATTVAHSVTGDVGVDLFVAAALYAASAQAVSGRAVWWLAFGAACGAGFACKFQGALAAWMAVPPLLLGLRDGVRGWKRLLGAGLLVALGFVGAAVLLNPALAIDTRQEWHDMRVNFAFIQNYGVPPERLAWPFGRKVAWGVAHNIPFVAACLGWGLVGLSLAATVLLSVTAWRPAVASLRRRRTVPASGETADEEASSLCSRWLLGIATFPWLAFLLATALKLEIQPFHFTFLIPPMALGVSLALSWWTEPPDGTTRPLAAAAAALLVAAALGEAVHGTAREMFFWRRPETRDLAARHSAAVFGNAKWGTDRRGTSRWLKRYYAEPAVLSCFRNAESRLSCPEGAWAEGQTLLPVPAVPMPADPDGDGWIFLGGPVFPRSDRMFTVPATGNGFAPPMSAADGSPLRLSTIAAGGTWTERILVYPAPPQKLLVGLRTGRLPARCEVSTSLSDPAPRRMIPPESQTVLELPRPSPVYSFPADEAAGKPAVWACRLRVRSQIGPVWVSVLETPGELALYTLHGPRGEAGAETAAGDSSGAAGTPSPSHPVAADLPLYASEFSRLRYLDSFVPHVLPVASGANPLPPSVPGTGPGLAAGPYRFSARIECPEPATVTLLLSDRTGTDAPDTLPSATLEVPAGEHGLEWTFSKPFAPYGATLRAAADVPDCTLLWWILKPDLDALAATGPVPPPPAVPLLPGGATPAAIPSPPLDAVYPGIATLLGVLIPDSWHASATIPCTATVRLDPRIPHKTFGNLAVFLHLVDERGELAGTLDFAFSEASFEGGPLRWKQTAPAVPPGTYTLLAGLFDGPRHASKLRYARAAVPDPDAPKHRTLLVKTVTVLPD